MEKRGIMSIPDIQLEWMTCILVNSSPDSEELTIHILESSRAVSRGKVVPPTDVGGLYLTIILA